MLHHVEFQFLALSANLQETDNSMNKLMTFETHNDAKSKGQGGESAHSTDLYACLDSFKKKKKLTSDNLWYCSKCKDHVEATK